MTTWQLIVAFQRHRKLLIDELSKINVSPEPTLEKMIALIISDKGTITFNSKDLLLGGLTHNNALYLTVICLQKYAHLALLDDGSIVNFYLWRTTKRLGVKKD